MEGYIGEVRLVAYNFAPKDWAFCMGQVLSITDNTALYSLIGSIYGGDGRSTFGLPDLRGKVALGQGQYPGSAYDYHLGQSGGTEVVTLNVNEIPVHTHTAVSHVNLNGSPTITIQANNADFSQKDPENNYPGGSNAFGTGPTQYASTANTTMNPDMASINNLNIDVETTNGSTGGGVPHPNMQPYLSLSYIICLSGLYPARS